MNPYGASIRRRIEKSTDELGPSPSVRRFSKKHGKDDIRRAHTISLVERTFDG